MSALEKLFSQIEDGKTVRIGLPVVNTNERLRLPCVYQGGEPPRFSLLFTPGTLPVDRIDTDRKCSIILDLAGQCKSLIADIEEVAGSQVLRMIGREVMDHEQMRDYFRVDMKTPVVATPVVPREIAPESDQWQLSGETIDVSGGGLLAAFPEPLETDRPLRINLVLPKGEGEVVQAVAHVVRSRKISEHCYHVAFHFDQIEAQDRDRIIACCFKIQRCHLRLKVQVKNPL